MNEIYPGVVCEGLGALFNMIEIRISSDPRLLTVVRAMIGQVCKLMECPKEEERKIVLAVDEACTNIIKHAYLGDRNQTITIFCNYDDAKLEVFLRDCGRPVDARCVRPRKLDEIRPGGLGTHFIRSIMDEVDYSFEEGCGNVLRMVKHIRKHGS